MYQIRPESVLTFLEDTSVRFPRFQRKQTWKEDQNIKLIISLFKNFPIGITIINKESLGRKSTKWLLDGRQRRNALEKMYQDPENIYVWAKKYFKLSGNDQPQDVKQKFWDEMEAYLNEGDEKGFNEAREEAVKKGETEFVFDGKTYTTNAIQDVEDDYDGEFSEDDLEDDIGSKSVDELSSEYNRSIWGNLDELEQIITTIHNKTATKSGFTSPFDFRKYIDNLSYSIDGNKRLSGRRLKTFIGEFLQYCSDHELNKNHSSALVSFYKERYQLGETNLKKVGNKIKQNWEDIQRSIEVVTIIKNRLQEAIIGIIETNDITATDSQMIFTLINKEGTKLSAVEILSAKPAWNIPVKSPSSEIEKQRAALYNAINTEVTDTVRWDFPATVYERLDSLSFLFPKLDYEVNSQLDKKVTMGFKILSGLYQKGIKKEDMDGLATNRDIAWESDIDEVVKDLDLMGKVLSDSSYFKFLKGLGKTLMDITSDAIALNFLFTCFHDFKRKGKPIGNSSKAKIFEHNSVILADRLVYEYVTFKWRGPGDSKVAKNILGFEGMDEKFFPLEDKIWLKTFNSINDEFNIDDTDITFGLSKSVVYHVYAMMNTTFPDASSIDIDHIIPQARFDSSSVEKADLVKNAVFNLCPLPSKDNIKKNKKRLREIEDEWLIAQIEHSAKISKDEFGKYSDVENWKDLRERRRKIFESDFLNARKKAFNN